MNEFIVYSETYSEFRTANEENLEDVILDFIYDMAHDNYTYEEITDLKIARVDSKVTLIQPTQIDIKIEPLNKA